MNKENLRMEIITNIILDLNDRSGLGFYDVDDIVLEEIIEAWQKIIDTSLDRNS